MQDHTGDKFIGCYETNSATGVNVKLVSVCMYVHTRAETNTRFARIFAWLHKYSNTMKVFGYTTK